MELLCTNGGVDFVYLYSPDESTEGKIVPKKKLGILAVQVTNQYMNVELKKKIKDI